MTNLRQNTEIKKFELKNFTEILAEDNEVVVFMYKDYQAELRGYTFEKKGERLYRASEGVLLQDDSETIIRALSEEEIKELSEFVDSKMAEDEEFLAVPNYDGLTYQVFIA